LPSWQFVNIYLSLRILGIREVACARRLDCGSYFLRFGNY
jgi:hypothetical protein